MKKQQKTIKKKKCSDCSRLRISTKKRPTRNGKTRLLCSTCYEMHLMS